MQNESRSDRRCGKPGIPSGSSNGDTMKSRDAAAITSFAEYDKARDDRGPRVESTSGQSLTRNVNGCVFTEFLPRGMRR